LCAFSNSASIFAESEGADDHAAFVLERKLARHHPRDISIEPRFLHELTEEGLAGADDALVVILRLPGERWNEEICDGAAKDPRGAALVEITHE
jgi:hypothetical protein